MNPWTDEAHDQRPGVSYRVALGGLQAFVERNELQAENIDRVEDAPSVSAESFTSVGLMQQLTQLVEVKTDMLEDLRVLERLEMEIATAGALRTAQLELRRDRIHSLKGQLQRVLAMKPVILRTLRKHVAPESVAIAIEHQRTFIDLFLKIGDELPRYSHALAALDASSMRSMTTTLVHRQQAYGLLAAEIKTTIAKFQTMCDDIGQLRNAYAHLHVVTTQTQQGASVDEQSR